MKLIIEIDEARYKDIQRIAEVQLKSNYFQTAEHMIAKGIPLEQIRAEIDSYCSDNRDRNDGLYIAMKIIDKYIKGDKG